MGYERLREDNSQLPRIEFQTEVYPDGKRAHVAFIRDINRWEPNEVFKMLDHHLSAPITPRFSVLLPDNRAIPLRYTALQNTNALAYALVRKGGTLIIAKPIGPATPESPIFAKTVFNSTDASKSSS